MKMRTSADAQDRTDAGIRRLTSSVSTRNKIRRLLWSIVQATLYRYSFHTWSAWRAFLLRAFGARIDRPCIIRRTSRVYYPWLLEIGALAVIGDRAEIYNLGKIIIGRRVMISQEAYLCAGTHDYKSLEMPLVTHPIVLEDDVWICARAFVGPGVTLHVGAVAGACAVVTRDVPAWTIVAGNPAKFVKDRVISEQPAS